VSGGIDRAALVARAERAAAARVERRVAGLAAAIGAEHPALRVERELGALRISGRGLGRAMARDARLRLPELMLGDGGEGAR